MNPDNLSRWLDYVLNDPVYSMLIYGFGFVLFLFALDWVGDRTWKKPRRRAPDRIHPAE